MEIIELDVLPDNAEALDDLVRPLLLRTEQNAPRKQEILAARKVLKAKLEGEAAPLAAAEALVVKLLGSVHQDGGTNSGGAGPGAS